ncbi:MAG: ribonuclease E/G, partial [Candidatus Subteraquimicrobiales bacterium]|nr:ribonuclease E/G [Candidatus Subteraquimicrobiales bacterium]
PKVWLRSGGFLVINQTEALTSIDVNTGKYIGESDLERTIFKTNLEAAKEIARQLRLRDIGGIIVVDFIDMQNQYHRDEVFEVFIEALSGDRMKSKVIETSRLGLVEMTRKNVSKNLLDFMCDPCSCCKGKGWVISVEAKSIEVARRIRKICKSSPKEAFLFKVSCDLSGFFSNKGREAFQEIERAIKKRIFILEDSSLSDVQFELVKEGLRKEVEDTYREFKKGAC